MGRFAFAFFFAFLTHPVFVNGASAVSEPSDDESETVPGLDDNSTTSASPSFTEHTEHPEDVSTDEIFSKNQTRDQPDEPTETPCVCACPPPAPPASPTPMPDTTNDTKCNSAALHAIMTKHMSVASDADLQSSKLTADISHGAAAAFGGGFMTVCQNGGDVFVNYQFFNYRCEVHFGEQGSGPFTCLSIRSYV